MGWTCLPLIQDLGCRGRWTSVFLASQGYRLSKKGVKQGRKL